MPTALRLVALVAVIVLTGCGATAAGPVPMPSATPSAVPSTPSAVPSTSAASSPTPAASRTPSAEPTRAPVPVTLRFTSTTVDGQPFDGASLAGKPVLLWFWAPWCPTCRSQADDVQAIARDYADRVTVLGVGSLSKDAAAIRQFAAKAPGPVHLDDQSGAVFRHFGVVEQSSFVLLDAEGRKAWSVGYGGSDDLAEQVAAVAR
jgi:thiol-disulfide isomerase/thioredoxin